MPNTEFHYPLEVKICCFERTRGKPVCGRHVPTPSPRFSRDLCGQYHRWWCHSTQSPGVILDLGYECNAIEMTSITCKFDSIPALLKSFNDSTAFGLRHHLFWWAHCWGEDEGYLCLPPHLHLCHSSHTHTHTQHPLPGDQPGPSRRCLSPLPGCPSTHGVPTLCCTGSNIASFFSALFQQHRVFVPASVNRAALR